MTLSRLFVLMSSLSLCVSAMAQPVPCRVGLEAFDHKDFAPAVESLTQCLDRPMPDAARSFVLQVRAQAFMELKAPEKALEDQKNAISIQAPKDVWPLVMLAVYYRELKQFDQALSALKSAQNYDENGPGSGPGIAVFYHMGQTLYQAGRYAEAIDAYTKGIPKQPDYGYALYHRGLAYEAMGKREEAKSDMQRAAELAPKDGYEPEIVVKLKEYGFVAHAREE